MTALVVGLAVAVLLLAVLVAGLLRSHAEILKALEQLGAGVDPDAAAPGAVDVPLTRRSDEHDALVATTLDGEALVLPLREGGDVVLAFLSSGCTTCAPFWEALSGPVDVPGRLVVVAQDDDEESASALRALAGRVPVEVVQSSAAWRDFGVPGSPYVVHVSGGRVVGEGTAATWERAVQLLQQADADRRVRGRKGRDRRDSAALAAVGIDADHPSLRTPAGP